MLLFPCLCYWYPQEQNRPPFLAGIKAGSDWLWAGITVFNSNFNFNTSSVTISPLVELGDHKQQQASGLHHACMPGSRMCLSYAFMMWTQDQFYPIWCQLTIWMLAVPIRCSLARAVGTSLSQILKFFFSHIVTHWSRSLLSLKKAKWETRLLYNNIYLICGICIDSNDNLRFCMQLGL